MKNSLITAILIAAFMFPPLSFATPGILKMFLAQYPASEGSQLSSCRTCHMPVQENCLNSYGLTLKDNGLNFILIDGDSATLNHPSCFSL
jgi:hypothetical protein